uniref:Glycoside hydrolase 35 catalytic domain-containing protein n=1 Tax=Acrobeloides nanus TaxID=290746 RepID=A0A914EBC7_9BILA
MYMVVGGDNFDFWNGAYSNGPVETAYWTLGPIGASGNPSDMYHSIRNMISNLTDWEYPPTPIPTNNP